jgi:ParB-like chromosome segregation protein Spo0J
MTGKVSRSVDLSEIDWDDTTCLISYGPPSPALLLSIRAVGLIQPPLLQRKRNGLLRMVCGSRRLAVCRELGLERPTCRLLPRSLPRQTCLRLAVHDNLPQRALNPVEKSLVLTKMAAYLQEPELIREFMPLLGLEPSAVLCERYRAQQLEPIILAALAAGRLPERTAFMLAALEAADRLALFDLFRELPFSASVQEELVELLVQIARRTGTTPAGILEDTEIGRVRHDEVRQARQRAEEIRRRLQALQFPRLTARRERFARELRELGLPAGVRLLPPPYFEGPEWRLECTFRRAGELRERLDRVAELAGQPAFQRLMEEKKGENSIRLRRTK